MNRVSKGKSPFYPGQPVPGELFVGRIRQINHIRERGVAQVEAGKPVTLYVQGEYGIGKSSIAGFVQWLAEREHGLHSIYAPLGAAESLEDVGAAILEGTLRSGAFDQKRSEKVRHWLARYIGEQSLFGVTIHAEALKKGVFRLFCGYPKPPNGRFEAVGRREWPLSPGSKLCQGMALRNWLFRIPCESKPRDAASPPRRGWHRPILQAHGERGWVGQLRQGLIPGPPSGTYGGSSSAPRPWRLSSAGRHTRCLPYVEAEGK